MEIKAKVECTYTIELNHEEAKHMIEILEYSRKNFDSNILVQSLARASFEILKGQYLVNEYNLKNNLK